MNQMDIESLKQIILEAKSTPTLKEMLEFSEHAKEILSELPKRNANINKPYNHNGFYNGN